MKFWLQFFLFLKCSILSSQVLEISDKPLDAAIFTVNLMNQNYDSAIGSPYINDEFLPAKIDNGITTQFIRFNCAENQIEVKQPNNKIILLDLSKCKKIIMSGVDKKVYHIYKYKDKKNKTRATFLELLSDDNNYKLYKKEQKKYIPKQNAEGYKEAKLEEFLPLKDIYYISDFKSKSSTLIEIPTKKKKFYSLFNKNIEKVKNFIATEKLNYQKSEDLKMIVAYYFKIRNTDAITP